MGSYMPLFIILSESIYIVLAAQRKSFYIYIYIYIYVYVFQTMPFLREFKYINCGGKLLILPWNTH